MLELTDWLVPGFDIDGFPWAIVGAVLLSIMGFFTSRRSSPAGSAGVSSL